MALADIGRIKVAIGEAHVERGARSLDAKSGMVLKQRDILVTGGDGRITVTFFDNSRFSAGPDSRVNLQRFEFNETTNEGRFDLEVEKGTIAIISGQIAEENKDAMKVRTPTSVLGVRGTRFIVQVQPALVLLPDEKSGNGDEKASSVTLEDEDGNARQVVTGDYAVAKIGSKTQFSTKTDPANVEAEHGDLLANIPAPPTTYVMHFETGTIDLTQASLAQMEALLEDVKNRPGADVKVTGHTDTKGKRRDNDRLSLKRAWFVHQELIKLGIDASRIKVAGRGERELKVETGDEVDEEQNRRVEVIVR